MRAMLLVIIWCALVTGTPAQQTAKPASPAASPSDVITINTELVQTDVTVFDKSGRLVEGLSRDEFVLTLDGKSRPISLRKREDRKFTGTLANNRNEVWCKQES